MSRRLYANGAHKYKYNMNVAYFRHKDGDPQLQINFRYKNAELGIDRDFNFCRNIEEPVTMCLDRMKTNIEKEFGKRNKKKSKKKNKEAASDAVEGAEAGSSTPVITVDLMHGKEKVNDLTFRKLLENNGTMDDVLLQIVGEPYKVIYNTPWVEVITLPTSILAGFFIYPAKLDLLFAEKKHSKFEWYRGLLPKTKKEEDIQWEKVGEGLTYSAKQEDIGYRIKIQCKPGNQQVLGPPVEYVSKCNVEAGPGCCPFENRHIFTTEKLSGDQFRVMSYNLLADLYADSDYTRKELFPYCPPYALNIDYRKQLFIKEILGYNADIMCLQEVDGKIFDLDLEPLLDTRNYTGQYQKKGITAEGIATFYNHDRFELVKSYGMNIGENIPSNPVFKSLWEQIKNNKKLVERIVARSTAVQVNTLKSKETDNVLVVANTHLYFHPDADHIRLLQVGFAMLYVEDIYKKTIEEQKVDKDKVSIIFCGDFNSVPECGIYKLMTEKFVDEHFIDWSSNEEEAVRGVNLVQPFEIQSACGIPNYTNFTAGFRACLDYIFYQTNNLLVKEVIPFPSDEELSAHIAIPSVVFPSDHVSLVADLKWKSPR